MSETTIGSRAEIQSSSRPNMSGGNKPLHVVLFFAVLIGALGFAAFSILRDMHSVGEGALATGTFVMLGIALIIALAFEFVNGFHDTANAVATVIYTRSLPPLVAVIWSGFWNFLGVALSTGAVAYSIVTLLPVELILQAGSGAGYAMIFALLIAAIVWNLVTWAFGIPNSSSHALVGSIMGVGLANQLMSPTGAATQGVDWGQVEKVFSALLFSPICGFVMAGLLLLVMKLLIRNKALYQAPKGDTPPPLWIRALLIFTCTGVSFSHGGNDGQKGMGLIMLILIGAAPTAYALNRAMPESAMPAFFQSSAEAEKIFLSHSPSPSTTLTAANAREIVGAGLRAKSVASPQTYDALAVLSNDISTSVKTYGSMKAVPAAAVPNVRTDMYLVADAIRVMGEAKDFTPTEKNALKSFQSELYHGTRFIPLWVKISVAIALGLGTMVGWKRIVVTVGEKIGKTHMTYAEGASAELVAMTTIGLAERYGLPVSTTHILSSGVAGTMAANGSGIQVATLRSMALAWVTTLPAAMAIAGILYVLFRQIF
ncbi:inorganic phosphate transporter [Gluconobacter sp. LMG 1744]|uniref:Phosphate transporter n=1 Tax=Gluconobacter cadivus TaxID=2728101 RepID=A0ABR9YX18_9PROT|nr:MULTISPECIES: inorganic phosphate transporter [unclassified Gluconobacter]MBF0889073.1 inorganic phosphate transporter [Gluconobacter cadivus]MBF0892437.1 inorganic phosphate transporter [Gluconobacter cadivus]MBS1060814.1 inorganic phosphate transporter [Gluconobacter sp. Dm-44]MBS1074744.1 inorganic phosphate transporter [Gluconobacter sp. Dm-73]